MIHSSEVSLPIVLDVDQAAQLLRCKPDTVRAACRSGDLPGIKWGDDWTLPAGALAKRLDQLALEDAAKRRTPQPPSATLHAIGTEAKAGGRKRAPPKLPV